eukprot:m.51036 g.51036  ORF g.51036 m.51036 type:complete len:414 (+) comp12952_c1_seq1:561-1802(+)
MAVVQKRAPCSALAQHFSSSFRRHAEALAVTHTPPTHTSCLDQGMRRVAVVQAESSDEADCGGRADQPRGQRHGQPVDVRKHKKGNAGRPARDEDDVGKGRLPVVREKVGKGCLVGALKHCAAKPGKDVAKDNAPAQPREPRLAQAGHHNRQQHKAACPRQHGRQLAHPVLRRCPGQRHAHGRRHRRRHRRQQPHVVLAYRRLGRRAVHILVHKRRGQTKGCVEDKQQLQLAAPHKKPQHRQAMLNHLTSATVTCFCIDVIVATAAVAVANPIVASGKQRSVRVISVRAANARVPVQPSAAPVILQQQRCLFLPFARVQRKHQHFFFVVVVFTAIPSCRALLLSHTLLRIPQPGTATALRGCHCDGRSLDKGHGQGGGGRSQREDNVDQLLATPHVEQRRAALHEHLQADVDG